MTNGYQRRIGRYGAELARALIAVSGVQRGDRVLDVGCGSGALTEPLAELAGDGKVVGVDPDPDALAACAERVPGVELVAGWAEDLPFADDSFDAVLAQLVVGLMSGPVAGVREMRRVAKPGEPVATCVWDFAAGMTALRAFWDAARAVDQSGAAEHDQAKTHAYSSREGLEELFKGAGLTGIEVGALEVGADYADFEDYWEPMTIPDGAPGRFYEALDPAQKQALREQAFSRLAEPSGPFRLPARAWYARGTA
jgi:SAM-dependent methyltransferase